MQLLWIGLTACRSAFSIFIISGPGRTVKPVLGAFCVCFRLIKRNVCSKVCSRKAKERKNQRSYALSFGVEDGTFPGALLFTHLTMQRQRLRCLRKKGIHPSMNSLFALSILWNI